jgi:hypothetical protein
VSCFYRRLIVYQNYSPLETIKQKKKKEKKIPILFHPHISCCFVYWNCLSKILCNGEVGGEEVYELFMGTLVKWFSQRERKNSSSRAIH